MARAPIEETTAVHSLAKMTNPAGFANVRAHAEAHLRAMPQRPGIA
ncbi:MAG: hypothetical protein LAN61_09310 [Acidobacteriia bacterium]|nr:hypothetical protein [Terriglobia bacterium]